MVSEEIIDLLKDEVIPATGCTEPVAIALAVACCHKLLEQSTPKRIRVILSANVFKNAKAVGIPGVQDSGVDLAIFLGLAIENPNLDLSILSNLSQKELLKARDLKAEIPLEIEIDFQAPPVYIEALLETEKDKGKSILQETHTNISFLQKNKEIILDKRNNLKGKEKKKLDLSKYPFGEIIKAAQALPSEDAEFLLEGIDLNMKIAKRGWDMEEGLKVGRAWKLMERKGLVNKDLTNRIAGYTAAASDARMTGIPLPVMTSAGSGNHGLVAIIPLALVGEELKKSKEDLIRGLALSHLVTIYIKTFTGRLSPSCGCAVASGAGAAAGLTFLLGGGFKAIEMAVKNVVSSLAGMVCDGGKVGCALKLCSSAITAWYSALLACENLSVPAGNGFIAESLEETIENLSQLSTEGMINMDKTIIQLLNK